MMDTSGRQIQIKGIVQGVGFRPFVYNLAIAHDLTGWVQNTSSGVFIEVDGRPADLQAFIKDVENSAPPLARIDSVRSEHREPDGFTGFEIRQSEPQPGAFQPISPDISICDDCLREMQDPDDRRYRYPFINCTNCGPRFTIIEDIPYDRPATTMSTFEMCSACRSEYENPRDRRFHAQPVACPDCGPHVWIEIQDTKTTQQAAVTRAAKMLATGQILCIKGLGGFHLACDAANTSVVKTLRERKRRPNKPLALMMPDLATVAEHCELTETEGNLVTSRKRPIVLLDRRHGSRMAKAVAPGQNTLGVMLPYTPLHYLLLAEPECPKTLVFTSGNLVEEPIAHVNDDARVRLRDIADGFLMHNRDIHIRCDDSVMRSSVRDRAFPVRRSRGLAPDPILLQFDLPPILATGAELKNAFCLTRQRYAFLSHHIGDLENFETLQSFEQGIEHLERLFRIRPELMAYDLHPNYLATRYALQRAEDDNIPAVGVQHHHAHIAACMAEHGLEGDQPVIGVAFDGTGYGDDGRIWGGEFLVANYREYIRTAHLEYMPLPGGDRAVKEPWRMALGLLWHAGIDWKAGPTGPGRREREMLLAQLENRINVPQTSSMGRLFDAVSSLVGIRQQSHYEGQAAIELEALADRSDEIIYPIPLTPERTLDPTPMIRQILADLHAGVPASKISGRFHNSIATMVDSVCRKIGDEHEIKVVALSGGVWQNITLLRQTVKQLEQAGFEVLIHEQVPPNDGGLALGQAMVAHFRLAVDKTDHPIAVGADEFH